MARGKKLERALWTGLAVAAFAGGIAAGPKVLNRIDKFTKWFENAKIERIEKGIEKPAPKDVAEMNQEKKEIPEKAEKKIEEEQIKDIEKTNVELAESVPMHSTEAKQLLEYLDKKNVDEQGKENFIELYKLFIEDLDDTYSWNGRKVFNKMVKNTHKGYMDLEFIESYNEMINRVIEIGDSNKNPAGKKTLKNAITLHHLYKLELIAEKGNLHAKTIDAITKTIDNAEDKDYAFNCISKFLRAIDTPHSYQLRNDFGVKFAQVTNKVMDEYYGDGTLPKVFMASMDNSALNQYMISYLYLYNIRDVLSYIEDNASYKERKKMLYLFENIVSSSGSEYFNSEDIIAGENMAESLGFYDFEIGMNLGFAINAIGEEKTRKLHEEYGIIYFGRYDKDLLEEIYNTLDPEYKKDKPVLLAIYGKEDWNGALYQDREKHKELRKVYKMIVYEVDSEYLFKKAIYDTYKKYGDIPVHSLVGHGYVDEIVLGSGDGDEDRLDVEDKDELAYLRYMFSDNPKIILNSCSTGKNVDGIGAVLSDVFDATLWAPVDPSGSERFLFDADGFLEDIEYMDTECRKFVDGKIVKTEESRKSKIEEQLKDYEAKKQELH